MSHDARLKIEKITTTMLELEREREALTEKLKQNILNILDDDLLLTNDYDTLIGGLLSLQHVLKQDDADSKKRHDLWKKEGIAYFMSQKKMGKKAKEKN